jgi:hypothetical protein
MLDEGKKTFRYETFGSEAFWGDTLQLQKAIAGEKNGGVGPGVSPKTPLSVGLKVDADALPDGDRDAPFWQARPSRSSPGLTALTRIFRPISSEASVLVKLRASASRRKSPQRWLSVPPTTPLTSQALSSPSTAAALSSNRRHSPQVGVRACPKKGFRLVADATSLACTH